MDDERRQLWPARLPAWKVAALAAADAQRDARRARRRRAAGPLADLPDEIFRMDLLGAEAIFSLGHTCSFFAALTSGEHERVRRALPLVRVGDHWLDGRSYGLPYARGVMTRNLSHSRQSRPDLPRYIHKGAPVPPHKRRHTTDGRRAPWWRPWARWRPIAHDRCICNECGELVACERMADMRMRICRDCAGGGDLCRLCGAPPPESGPPFPGPSARSCRMCWDSTMDRVSCNAWVRLRLSM